ncbi:MAG: hypothetical protein IT463_04710 [Planctomycetes bacterium]|nr:hypothetical protein [Planctomycetota bacterium]
MPKLQISPNTQDVPRSFSGIMARLIPMGLMAASLFGVCYMLLSYSGSKDGPVEWSWDPADIRTNFDPILTPEQIRQKLLHGLHESLGNVPLEAAGNKPAANTPPANKPPEVPFSNEPPVPRDDYEEMRGVDQRDLIARRNAEELELARKLSKGRAFNFIDEVQNILDWVPLSDAESDKTMAEFEANRGRQSPPTERLCLQVLRRLPAADAAGYGDYVKLAESAYFDGHGTPAIEECRGRVFALQGRLFDLYEIKLPEAVVLPDGTRIESYYEGMVAYQDRGALTTEYLFEHRLALFHALKLPADLTAVLDADGKLAHDDKLATEAVMVKLTGAYLRRWVYSREVAPFSTSAKRILSQAHAPLLLTADVERSGAAPYELTDELLQQVKDALREDPKFVESEAAYYALLAKANASGDAVKPVEGIGYFDLAGIETGPRYRGQGVHVAGMIGDNYAPVILPPNISGLRRVFRALVLADTGNLHTPKRYMVDMLEAPTGLEPRALVGFDARYYRNVFEMQDASAEIRPLLIVRRVASLSEQVEDDSWMFAAGGGIGVVIFVITLSWFLISDRRERKRFEGNALELSRQRHEKRGGFKLKPLPAKGSAAPATGTETASPTAPGPEAAPPPAPEAPPGPVADQTPKS